MTIVIKNKTQLTEAKEMLDALKKAKLKILDGGQSMMELATIMQHHIPVKIIVMKNNYLGMVREYQHYTYKDHYSVVDIKDGSPDLEKLSAAYDIPFLRVENMSDAREKLQAFLKDDTTMLMECLVDPMDLVK